MLIPSTIRERGDDVTSLSRRVNANSQHLHAIAQTLRKLIKKGEC